MNLGISGTITRMFIRSPLTPLILLASLGAGLMALAVLPREEEPQISVPMVDIMVSANGLKAEDAAELVTKPLEDIVQGLDQVEHVYSQTNDDFVTGTARFDVGTDEDIAILRVHEQIRANIRRLPKGIPEPVIIGRGINDVAILTLTLSPKDGAGARWNDNKIYAIAEELQHELVKVDDVGLSYIVGGRADQIRVEPDPERLSLYGITLNQLVAKIENANGAFALGRLRDANSSVPVVAGKTLRSVPEIGLLLLTSRDLRPVYVKDVADIIVGSRPEEWHVWNMTKDGNGGLKRKPAVTLALAKRKGANAVNVSAQILDRLEGKRGNLIPADLDVTVARDYGATAAEKADELLFHLALATVSIVLLISLVLGWREGAVVLVVVPATILLTLFASYLMGYTINRVSLFALIFSIGILVDDAIVVIENIVRHWRMNDKRPQLQAAIEAVAEVGNPTIIATLTIVAALLPMLFVSGLMGPYMSPIPANASVAMVFSFFIAVTITPWLLYLLRARKDDAGTGLDDPEDSHEDGGLLGRLYRRCAAPLLKGRQRAAVFLIVVGAATLASMVPFVTKDVTVKLLPFDNKSELQVVVDLPEGSSLEATDRVIWDVARRLGDLPELANIQAYAGTSMPFNFNGLVRHYYLRKQPQMGDLQINLVAKHDRDRASHAIALDVRQRLKDLHVPAGTLLKVVEVPPGPPVLSTLLAEIYGPDAAARRKAADQVRKAFQSVDFIVDVDDSFGTPAKRIRFVIDQENLEFLGVEEEAVMDTLAVLIGGVQAGFLHLGQGRNPAEITIRLPKSNLFIGEHLLSTPVPSRGGTVELGDVVQFNWERASYPIFRRDGREAEMVMAELAGRFEAPI
jgi:multidrug efflux pump subunit AcrB